MIDRWDDTEEVATMTKKPKGEWVLFEDYAKLQAKVGKLQEAIKNIPTNEFGEAQTDGCDAHGAWHCFLDALKKWENQTLNQ